MTKKEIKKQLEWWLMTYLQSRSDAEQGDLCMFLKERDATRSEASALTVVQIAWSLGVISEDDRDQMVNTIIYRKVD